MKEVNITLSVDDILYPVINQIAKYTGLIPYKTGLYDKKYYIYLYVVNTENFDIFLHREFNKLIEVLQVTVNNGITVLEWPEESHCIVLKEIEDLQYLPNI